MHNNTMTELLNGEKKSTSETTTIHHAHSLFLFPPCTLPAPMTPTDSLACFNLSVDVELFPPPIPRLVLDVEEEGEEEGRNGSALRAEARPSRAESAARAGEVLLEDLDRDDLEGRDFIFLSLLSFSFSLSPLASTAAQPTRSLSLPLLSLSRISLFSLSLLASSHSRSSTSLTSLAGVLKSSTRTLSPNPYLSLTPSALPSLSTRIFLALRKLERRSDDAAYGSDHCACRSSSRACK